MEPSSEGALQQLTPYPTEVCLIEYPFIAAFTLRTSRISVGYQTSLYLLFISKTPYCIYRLTKVPQSKGPPVLWENPPLSQHLPVSYLPTIHNSREGYQFILGLVSWAASLTLDPQTRNIILWEPPVSHSDPYSFQFNTGRTYSRFSWDLLYLQFRNCLFRLCLIVPHSEGIVKHFIELSCCIFTPAQHT